MEIVQNKALKFRTRKADLITNSIPKSAVLRRNGDVAEMLVHWGWEETRVLRNMKIRDVPYTIARDYNWPGVFRPFDHQKDTAGFLTAHHKCYCFSEQGTGKTMAVAWAADYLLTIGAIKRVLIVCPVSVMDAAWRADLFRTVMHRRVEIAHGTAKNRIAAIESGAEFVIINYDGIHTVQETLEAGGFDLIVLDEANAVKNVATRRWKSVNKLVRPDTRLWLLTGTPASQALTLDSNILTPTGWVKMRDISVGDEVIGSDGAPTNVMGVWPQGYKEIFRVHFNDGTHVDCTGDHLWAVNSRGRRSRGLPELILRTDELDKPRPLPNSNNVPRNNGKRSLLDSNGAPRWHIPAVAPVLFRAQKVPLDPYILGVMLGNGYLGGTPELSTPDEEIVGYVRDVLPEGVTIQRKNGDGIQYRITTGRTGSLPGEIRGPAPNPVSIILDTIGVRHCKASEKFVPDMYKWNTIDVRIGVLRGLCDTDGTIYGSSGSTCAFSTVSARLASDVIFLVRSLGGYAVSTVHKRTNVPAPGGIVKNPLPIHVVTFGIPINPFRCSRKASAWAPRWRKKTKSIVDIEARPTEAAQCITVAAADGLFVTEDFALTHNSPMDAYGLAKLVSPDRVPRYKTAFRDSVMIRLTQFKWAPRLESKKIVHDALQPAIRYTKAECLSLPPMMYADREVEMTKMQRTAYNDLRNRMVLTVAGEVVGAVNSGVLMSKLMQIASGAVLTETGNVLEFDISTRYKVLREILEETENKVVVFVHFTAAIELLRDKLRADGITVDVIDGNVAPHQRGEIIRAFQTQPEPHVLILQPQAAAHGITLTAADTIVWWAPIPSVETYLQGNARIHRTGQSRHTTVYHLYGSPAEKRIYNALKSNKEVHELTVDLFD